jgi:type I restriction enzyme S subunit
MVKIDRAILEGLPLLVPPIEEQCMIAKVLTSVDKSIQADQDVLRALQDARAIAHTDLCSGGARSSVARRRTPWGNLPLDWPLVRLRDTVHQVKRACAVNQDALYTEVGVRSHGKGLFLKAPVAGRELGKKRVFLFEPGCLVFNIVFAWEGAIAVSSETVAEATVVSHRFPMFRPIDGVADPRYLCHQLLTARGLQLLGLASPGGAGRNRTLNQRALLDINLPCPPLAEQREIADALDAMDRRILAESKVLAARCQLKLSLAEVLLNGSVRVPGVGFRPGECS